MRHVTSALKSGKLATILALAVATLYTLSEFGTAPVQMAEADITVKALTSPGSELVDAAKTVALTIPTPLTRPDDLPFVEQPHHVTVVALAQKWSGLSFDLDSIRGGAPVPRHFVEQIPVDILDIEDVSKRKEIFLSVALPLVLKVNEEILAQRKRLLRLEALQLLGEPLSEEDRDWLLLMSRSYGTAPGDLNALLERADMVPVSLALAQAIEESGWGTSRFAREGNALFGQRVWSVGDGIVPAGRQDDASFEVRMFGKLIQSIRGYARNLNSHDAYEEFRQMRARLKQQGGAISGYMLTTSLATYSERGLHYVKTLQQLIRVNGLGQFDNARLTPEQFAQIFN